MRYILYCFFIVFALCNNAFANEQKQDNNPLIDFLKITKSNQDTCVIFAEMSLFTSKLEGKSALADKTAEECSNDAINSTKTGYKKAIEFVKKNKNVSSMVKDYYAFWITSMRTIPIGTLELNSPNKYKERLAKDKAKVLEMSERINLEFEL